MASTSFQPISAFILIFLSAYWMYLLPALLMCHFLYNRYVSPLRHIPGPILASATRLRQLYSVWTGQNHHDHINMHKRYGPLVRVCPNQVSVASPMVARQVLAAGKGFSKTRFYSVFPPADSADIFTETRESVHAQKKKVVGVPYSMSAMQRLCPFIDDTIDKLVDKLSFFITTSGSDSGPGKVDLGAWLHYFTFDVLGEVAFSRSFGFLDHGRDVEGAIKAIDNNQWYNGLIGQIPELDWIFRRNPLWQTWVRISGKEPLITRLAKDEVRGRRPFVGRQAGKGEGGGQRDLLAALIEGHLKDPKRFGEDDIFAVAHGAIFAGSDSTASTMQSFFHCVLSDPSVHHKLVTEISNAVSQDKIPSQGNISWFQAQSLPYFQACLREAMRLRPAVGLNITRIVPSPGITIEGQYIPGGTEVAVNGWVVHRDEGIFGSDAESFRPERWLANEEKFKLMDRNMFQFGGGAHVCIGRNLALLEMNKVLPKLLRDYSFSLVQEGPLKTCATFFVIQTGLEVNIKRRMLADKA